jgi:hypothetical protein
MKKRTAVKKADAKFEADIKKRIKELDALKHRPVMRITFLDGELRQTGTGLLTIDQHGKFWIDRYREVLPPEVVEWYSNAMFGSEPVEIEYPSMNHCRAIFNQTAQIVMNRIRKEGAK